MKTTLSLYSRILSGCLFAYFAQSARAEPAVESVEYQANGVVFKTATEVFAVQPWSSRTIRVTAEPGGVLKSHASFAVTAVQAPANWHVTKEAKSTTVSVRLHLSAVVSLETGLISFLDCDGKVLLREANAHHFEAARVPRNGFEASATFSRNRGERLFGAGVISDELFLPQATVQLAEINAKIRVPVIYSSNGFGFFWDNPARGDIDLTPNEVKWSNIAGDAIDYYVMAGPSADETVGEYRLLTGNVPMFPKWAFGFWFSRNRYSTQEQILDAAATFRERQFPIDLIVQDYFYWAPDKFLKAHADNWGSHKFESGRYPDPKGMIAQLHSQDHIHFMAVVWGKFEEDTEHFHELEKTGALYPFHGDWAGPTLSYYDPFNANGRQIFGRQVMESLFSLGLDGFWIDGAEPEIDPATYDSFDSAAGPVSKVASAFPLMHTTSFYEAQRATTTDKRVVLLPRSAWAGLQRNSAATWTGDIFANWETLGRQVRGLENYSIAGLPYITTDVGGYHPTGESDRELFIRWFQWGAFCPIFRVHGLGRPHPWQYGQEAETILRSVDRLRYG